MPLAKGPIRDQWKRRRRLLPPGPSDAVCAQILQWPVWMNAPQVALYFARSWEADLVSLWQAAPHKCAFPKVEHGALSFYRIHSLETLQPGYAGIMEPTQGERITQWGPLDLVLVPGVAFDQSGARVGSGKGFYDRFLASVPAFPCGICWESQVVPEGLCQEPTDVAMKALCTERRIWSVHP